MATSRQGSQKDSSGLLGWDSIFGNLWPKERRFQPSASLPPQRTAMVWDILAGGVRGYVSTSVPSSALVVKSALARSIR